MILHAPDTTDARLPGAGTSPLDVLRAWPAGEPLAALVSGPGARWTTLCRPTRTIAIDARGPLIPPRGGANHSPTPLATGWIGMIAYEAGRHLEPRAGARPAPTTAPIAIWHRCDGALVHDRSTRRWHAVGDAPTVHHTGRRDPPPRAGEARPIDGRDRYVANVERTIEYIRAGDVYQANIAHRLQAPFDGSARALFAELMRASGAWHGAYLEWDDASGRHAVLSASPELFLRVEPTGRVEARPMKGTASRRDALLASEKDRAELSMIVDLMRNDLGRVCRCGTVRVEQPRTIERHGRGDRALHQGVATVAGVLRPDQGLEDLLGAAFPAGSVTGAPKIRAMQIIDELEGFDRGAFCGSIGYVGDDGSMQLNVGIRTASLSGAPSASGLDVVEDATLTYPVGAGIVADSRPEAEWEETMAKAGVLRSALAGLRSTP